jgi:phage virion morphogenesis protein
MQVTMTIDDLPSVKKKLEDIASNITDTKPLMQELANHLYNISRDSFDDEKSPDGRKWSPLSESTKKYKSTSKMLYKDGDLQDKFIYHSTRTEAVVGTNANNKGYNYPAVHQFGTKDKKTPDRAFMPIDLNGKLYDGVESELEEIVVNFIESAVN